MESQTYTNTNINEFNGNWSKKLKNRCIESYYWDNALTLIIVFKSDRSGIYRNFKKFLIENHYKHFEKIYYPSTCSFKIMFY